MEKFELELSGMTCESCGRLIRKIAEQNGAVVNGIDFHRHSVSLSCEPEKIDGLKKQLAEKGYPEKGSSSISRGDPSRVGKYIAAVIAGERHVEVETKLLNYALGSATALILLGGIAYSTFLQEAPNASSYIPLLLLTIVGGVVTVYSYSHMKCYRKSISCMNGMMVGMTMGMISGFMVGALIGATNGMFIGSTAGMAVGIALGVNLGGCCGISGAMEGIMAGLMAGIMGAMTSVMMLNDNLIAFLYILFGVCSFVLGGLSYLMFREAGSAPAQELRAGFPHFLVFCALLVLGLSAIMLFGPRGPLTYL